MIRAVLRRLLQVTAAIVILLPTAAYAQVGNIAGVARDSQGGALPGVTVTVTSPALIEKTRMTVTDGNGRYQITNLPVGVYEVTFSLESFSDFRRANVELTSDFTANVNADMTLGARTETVIVSGQPPTVDIQNARQRQVFSGEELRDLPTTRDLRGLADLVPGISLGSSGGQGNVQSICSGGSGGFIDSPSGGAFGQTSAGGLSGCTPLLDSFNSHASMNDPASLNQGRIQVDGLGIQSVLGGGRMAYIPDVANAQEVTFTLSGALGESETGGATINIVPRTGGNRYSGNFFNSYSNSKFYDRNQGTRQGDFRNRLQWDYDVNVSYGGPLLRDRLWFYTSPRQRARKTNLTDAYPNVNEGIFGANYKSDTSKPSLDSNEMYKNVSLRLTLQASQKNKFNIFWDEQYTCLNPCEGVNTSTVSPEAEATNITQPLHVAQLSWTNPFTNRVLLEAGVSHNSSHVDSTRNRFWPTYSNIPRISESGATVQHYNASFNNATSGSLNNEQYQNNDNISTRASFSYITGSHNIKLGYQGGFLQSFVRQQFNDLRLSYNYSTPEVPSACVTAFCLAEAALATPRAGVQLVPNPNGSGMAVAQGCYESPVRLTGADIPKRVAGNNSLIDRPWCGAINLAGNPNNLNDPTNSQYLPIPTSFSMYIPSERKERVWFTGVYLQDQWTAGRFTLNGAVRYDNAQSRFLETCIGPDVFTPNNFCLNSPDAGEGKNGQGVNFQDITPRFGAAWDVFGNGKTSLKFSMGKYLGGASVSGVYTAANVASGGRFLNSLTRTWSDTNGDRVIDCDLRIPERAPVNNATIPANGECDAITGATAVSNYRRFGRSPDDLDESGLTIGLGDIQCGRKDSSRIDAAALAYCDAYYAAGGDTLLNGWNRRRYQWRLSLGVQHEILPRLSAEVTYNRQSTHNATLSDDVGVGCDLYGGEDPDACMTRQVSWQSEAYDFYGIMAPVDPRLPMGGGYLIPGFADRKPGVAAPNANAVTVQTLDHDGRIKDVWRGVDVNVTLRARGGLRLSGGTSTGARLVDNCRALLDANDVTGTGPGSGVVLWEGRERSCAPDRPFQTNVRGTATYTIPWVDVLVSTVFSYRPGAFVNAFYTVSVNDLVWMPGSEYRATNTEGCSTTVTTGCLIGTTGNSNTAQTVDRDLLANDTTGEGIRLFDIKLAKNIRFGGKRLNLGMDLYNAFNSDAALGYCERFPTCGDGSQWMRVFRLTSPRSARFQVQFDF